jgi:hypothetical protein
MHNVEPETDGDAVTIIDLYAETPAQLHYIRNKVRNIRAALHKRKRFMFWIMLVILLAIAASIFAQPFRPPHSTQTSTLPDPNQTLSSFCMLMKTQSVSSAYQHFAASAQGSKSENQFLREVQQEFTSFHGLQGCGILILTNNGTQATVLLTCSVKDPPQNAPQIILKADMRNEHGTWKMLSLSNDPAYSDAW